MALWALKGEDASRGIREEIGTERNNVIPFLDLMLQLQNHAGLHNPIFL